MLFLKKKNYKPISYQLEFKSKKIFLNLKGILGFIKIVIPKSGILNMKISNFVIKFKKKGLVFMFYKLFYNAFIGVSSGWFVSLELIGRGFSVFFFKNFLFFNLGFSHNFCLLLDSNIKCFINPIKKTNFLLFSSDFQALKNLSFFIKKLKPLNIYKGTGIKFRNEIFKLKQGKKGTT